MRIPETFGSNEGLQLPSKEAAQLIVGSAKRAYLEVVKAGVRPYRKKNKEILHFGRPERNQNDDIDYAIVRVDAQTQDITSLDISALSPVRRPAAEVFKKDFYDFRLQFPRSHHEEETQRVVIDSWSIPATDLNDLLPLESDASYELYEERRKDLFERKGVKGIPVAATRIDHLVVGRPEDLLCDSDSRKVLFVVNALGVAASREVNLLLNLSISSH
jgi:hypothetical protein